MKALLTLFIFLLTWQLHAKELNFFEDQTKYRFQFDEETSLLISHDCQEKCQAYLSLQKITKLPVHRDGGANPGGIICVEQLKGEIKTLNDKDGNQNSFCEFEDKSLVGLGTLQKVWRDLKK